MFRLPRLISNPRLKDLAEIINNQEKDPLIKQIATNAIRLSGALVEVSGYKYGVLELNRLANLIESHYNINTEQKRMIMMVHQLSNSGDSIGMKQFGEAVNVLSDVYSNLDETQRKAYVTDALHPTNI